MNVPTFTSHITTHWPKWYAAAVIFCVTFLQVSTVAAEGETGDCGRGKLCNPLAVKSIKELLLAIVNIIQVIMVPIVIFFIIYSGFLFVTAQGNPEEVSKAKRALLYAVIGGVIILGAEAITVIIGNVVSDFQS